MPRQRRVNEPISEQLHDLVKEIDRFDEISQDMLARNYGAIVPLDRVVDITGNALRKIADEITEIIADLRIQENHNDDREGTSTDGGGASN